MSGRKCGSWLGATLNSIKLGKPRHQIRASMLRRENLGLKDDGQIAYLPFTILVTIIAAV
jgi:hypothetical protein